MRTHNPYYARSEYHTQLVKMSFDKTFDPTAGMYSIFVVCLCAKLLPTKPTICNGIFQIHVAPQPLGTVHYLPFLLQSRPFCAKIMEGGAADSCIRPTIMGNIFSDYFSLLTGISDAKKKTHQIWDQKTSLFLAPGIIEARNQRIW